MLSVKQHYQDTKIAQSYDDVRFRGLAGRTFDRLEKRALGRALNFARREIANPKVLDLPCGTGRITELFLDAGLQVTAGDISPAMLEQARIKCARFGDHACYRVLDLDNLDLPEGSFDLVSCIRLLHHLHTHQREPIIQQLARVTRQFVLINVSYSSPYYRFRRRVKSWLRQGISTASSSWAELQHELEAARLRLVYSTYVFPYLSEDLVLLLKKI